MPYIGKKPADIIATAVDTTTGTFSGAVSASSVDADGGVTVDNITIDGTEIDLSSGDLTLDAAGDIILDADGSDISLRDAGTEFGRLSLASSGLQVFVPASDADLFIKGNDGGSTITAMTIDMSEGGNVGIGTTSPDGTLHVHSASAGSVTALTDADDFVVENSSHGGISILTPDSNRSAIFFGHASDSLKLQIRHDGASSLSQFISDDAVTFNVGDGTERMRIDANGHITMPTQPAFSAIATGQNDLAVSSTLQVGFAGTERFDLNSDFNTSNSTFTAPVTGKYQFNVGVRVKAIDTGAGYVLIRLKTSNASYDHILDSDEFSSDLDFYFFAFSILADMDAADTCIIEFFQNGGTQQTDIDGASYWSGYLVA